MVFGGTLTAGGLKVGAGDGKLTILSEGKHRKFVPRLEQTSYNGQYAKVRGQTTVFVTERAVFRTSDEGLELIEIAPGIDLNSSVLDQMGFRPIISPNLKTMDERIFRTGLMGVGDRFATATPNVHPRLQALADAQSASKS
jgi:propionate CoA-transferase